jgi:hypothetical protein
MADFTVEMRRSPGLSNREARARISRVYALLLSVARSKAEQTKTGQMEKEASAGESLAATPTESTEKPAGNTDLSPK